MKKKISAVIHSLGGYTAYSGKTKTMYIHAPKDINTLAAIVIIVLSYNLQFKLEIE